MAVTRYTNDPVRNIGFLTTHDPTAEQGGGGEPVLVGTAAGASMVAGTLTVLAPLVAAAAGSSAAAGSLTVTAPLAGAVAGTSAAGGVLAVAAPLVGAAAGQSAAVGALTVQGGGDPVLVGLAAGTSAVGGVLSVAAPLAGATAGGSAAVGSLTVLVPLIGGVVGVSTATGVLDIESVLVGAAVGGSGAAAVLTVAGPAPLVGVASGSSSATGVLSYAGTRVDATGRGNDLVSYNVVGQAPGVIDQAAAFDAALQQRLAVEHNPDMALGDIDFTIDAWVWISDLTQDRVIWAKGSVRCYYSVTTGRIVFDGGFAAVTADEFGPVPAAVWLFVVSWHDAAANELGVQVGTELALADPDTAPDGGGVPANEVAFTLGADSGAVSGWHHGRVDAVGIRKRVLTAAERVALWNNGEGWEP